MKIKDQIAHFLYICQMDSWSVMEMGFLMYKRNNSWNYIFSANNQVDKLIFTCFRYLHAQKHQI